MDPSEIITLIKDALGDAHVEIIDLTGTRDHFSAVVVSSAFEGSLPLKQHRMVNAALREHIDSGAIHALQLKTFTPSEWDAMQG